MYNVAGSAEHRQPRGLALKSLVFSSKLGVWWEETGIEPRLPTPVNDPKTRLFEGKEGL